MKQTTNTETTDFPQQSQAENILKKTWTTPNVEVLPVPDLTRTAATGGKDIGETLFYDS